MRGRHARLTAVVVLPTPPFWFAMVNMRRLRRLRERTEPGCRTWLARWAAAPIGVSFGEIALVYSNPELGFTPDSPSSH